MALATRCPACGTIFRISTTQASAKGGMVRCGQCRNVFNSLDALVRVEDLDVIGEDLILDLPETATAPPARGTEVAPSDVAPDAIEAAEPSDAGPLEATSAEPLDRPDERATDDPDETPADSPWWLPLPERTDASLSTEAPLLPLSPAQTQPEVPADPRDDAGQLLSGRSDAQRDDVQPVAATSPAFMRPEAVYTPSSQMGRWTFGLLCVVAGIVLLGQVVHAWRDELATRWPTARPWLNAACAPLRCKVDYPAQIDAITIESASIQATGPGLDVYVLTALLRNRDVLEVRYPNLELVLTDLQDRPILRRALRPEDYLPPAADTRRPQSGFAAESELPIRVTFELNNLRFAGYRLDRFYP